MSSAYNTQKAEILIRFSVLMLRLYPHLSPTEKLIIDTKAQTGGPAIFLLPTINGMLCWQRKYLYFYKLVFYKNAFLDDFVFYFRMAQMHNVVGIGARGLWKACSTRLLTKSWWPYERWSVFKNREPWRVIQSEEEGPYAANVKLSLTPGR